MRQQVPCSANQLCLSVLSGGEKEREKEVGESVYPLFSEIEKEIIVVNCRAKIVFSKPCMQITFLRVGQILIQGKVIRKKQPRVY
jgi:hypothetical protein